MAAKHNIQKRKMHTLCIYNTFSLRNSLSDVTYGQVWWPILRICALQFNPFKVHTHSSEHTHTHREHTDTHPEQWAAMLRPGSSCGFSALLKGTSVMVLKKCCTFTPSQSLSVPRLELSTLGLWVQLSTIRPSLPPHSLVACITSPSWQISLKEMWLWQKTVKH